MSYERGDSRVLVIAGPPCSGKSTLAGQLARPEDLVLDRDVIARELGSPRMWLHERPYGFRAEHRLRQRLDLLAADRSQSAIVVRGLPTAEQRDRITRQLGAEIILLDPGRGECVRRARVDGRPLGTVEAINNWYRAYLAL